MRVLFLSPTGALGGAELSLLDLMASLHACDPGLEQHVCVGSTGPLLERAQAIGARVHLLPLPDGLARAGDSALGGSGIAAKARALGRIVSAGASFRDYVSTAQAIVHSLRPDIIHSNGVKTHLVSRFASGSGIPVVWHVRDFIGSRPLASRLLRWARHGAAGVVAISEAVERDVRATLPGVRSWTIYNGIDLQRFSPGSEDGRWLDAAAGLPDAGDDYVRVGLVATYARWKGHELFLRAIAQVPSTLRARFYVVGGGIYSTVGSQVTLGELQDMADNLRIRERVGFVPFQSDPARVYRSLDILVHASTQPEPFGRTIVEAMACGKPVIVSRAGGAAELFRDGFDGVAFDPGNASALAAAVSRLVCDPGASGVLGANALNTARERFARERLGPAMLAVYNSL